MKKPNFQAESWVFALVPVAGVEPAPCCQDWILSPARLPIPSHRHIYNNKTISYCARFFKCFFTGTQKRRAYPCTVKNTDLKG